CILVGAMVGLLFSKIGENYKETIMQGIGLTVVIIGLQMALQTESIIIVLLSLLLGAIVGEFLMLEEWLNRGSHYISSKFTSNNQDSSQHMGQAFITASLIFVIGAMAILGALDSGLRGDHEILITKSLIDGFTSLVLSSTLGIGVAFSALPVFIYQGTITLLATKIEALIPDALFQDWITEITAVGGLLIIAIGLSMLKMITIRITNLLPSLLFVGILLYIQYLT